MAKRIQAGTAAAADRTGDRVGYARVSTRDQTIALQLDALHAAGCESAVGFGADQRDKMLKNPVIPGSRARADSQPALIEVLSLLRPDRVLFTGDDLWWHVPARTEKLSDINIGFEEGRLPLETFVVPEAGRVFVTQTAHPRSGKFGRWLTPFLKEFIVRDWNEIA